MGDRTSHATKLAIGRQLRHCPSVHCLGVRRNLLDYSPAELEMIRKAAKIYYPTLLLAEALTALGKDLFPSVQTIRYAGDKILQTHLFQLLGLPMPRTKIYYGQRQKENILDDFAFPFVAKVPRKSSKGRGVSLIQNRDQLNDYLRQTQPAYIQEYLPIHCDMRVVILGCEVVHAYWRKARAGDFRTNVAQGGSIVLTPLPKEALELAIHAARQCRFDQVGMDICVYQNRFYIFEANMAFGMDGFKAAGLDFRNILRDLVERDVL